MTTEEKGIMADMFYFLRDHNDPPAVGIDTCDVFWRKAAKDISVLVSAKWNNHPLAMDMCVALYKYLDKKCRTKGGENT